MSMNQNGEMWSSANYGIAPELAVDVVEVSDDPRVAVVVSVATDASGRRSSTRPRSASARSSSSPPAVGARNGVIEDGPTATALAEQVRDVVRDQLNATSSEVHLYLATPAGLALLLGNRWNRLRPTVLYEFVDGTYVRTIEVPA